MRSRNDGDFIQFSMDHMSIISEALIDIVREKVDLEAAQKAEEKSFATLHGLSYFHADIKDEVVKEKQRQLSSDHFKTLFSS